MCAFQEKLLLLADAQAFWGGERRERELAPLITHSGNKYSCSTLVVSCRSSLKIMIFSPTHTGQSSACLSYCGVAWTRNNETAGGGQTLTDGRTDAFEQDVVLLWHDGGVRAAYGERHRYWLLDAAAYYFDNVERYAYVCWNHVCVSVRGLSGIVERQG